MRVFPRSPSGVTAGHGGSSGALSGWVGVGTVGEGFPTVPVGQSLRWGGEHRRGSPVPAVLPKRLQRCDAGPGR